MCCSTCCPGPGTGGTSALARLGRICRRLAENGVGEDDRPPTRTPDEIEAGIERGRQALVDHEATVDYLEPGRFWEANPWAYRDWSYEAGDPAVTEGLPVHGLPAAGPPCQFGDLCADHGTRARRAALYGADHCAMLYERAVAAEQLLVEARHEINRLANAVCVLEEDAEGDRREIEHLDRIERLTSELEDARKIVRLVRDHLRGDARFGRPPWCVACEELVEAYVRAWLDGSRTCEVSEYGSAHGPDDQGK